MKKNKTFKIALGGICLALTIIFMFAGSIVPGVELTLFALSSFFTAIMIIETGLSGGVIFYLAASILGFIIAPDKLAIVPYIGLFGYYGIVKFLIEKVHSATLQISFKVIFFAAVLTAGVIGFKELLMSAVDLPDVSGILIILGGILMMMLYDYIYTLVINYYFRRIKNKGIDEFKLS
jgi:hypothetical protein